MANKLVNEQSPYLLQHAHNPVNWFPWGDEAFEEARRRDVPVLVSIGYAACHWCHVMERESFENEEVAAYMNEHFVCIKVDREEHPDVDHMFMDAVQAIGGSGGWPLNVFATHDRAPFYGGTYYPPKPAYNRPSWPQLLERMNNIWQHRRDEVDLQATQMIQHLRQASAVATAGKSVGVDAAWCEAATKQLLSMADREWGGFGNAPKFPGTMAINYLLEHYHYTGHKDALAQALRSLDAMAAGGIYDHLGGGFARYATDREWLIPHFEKMLYDSALLIINYCDAYALTGNIKYRLIAEETIAFVERELHNGSGGYFCALDADSDGVEGSFYTWTWDDWSAHSGDEQNIAATYFGVTQKGNWEHTNILHEQISISELATQTGKTEEEVTRIVDQVKARLMNARTHRNRPITDDKSLLSWNALMNQALSKAAMSFDSDELRQRALNHAGWMLETFRIDGKLLHSWKDGTARIPAKLDDYAYLIRALLQLMAASGSYVCATDAAMLINEVIRDFGGDDAWFYYSSVHQTDIPVRKVDLYDGATPSANAVMADNLWVAGILMEESSWVSRSQEMIYGIQSTAGRYTYSFGYWASLLQRTTRGLKTAIVGGVDAKASWKALQQRFLPNAWLLLSAQDGKSLPILKNKIFNGNLYIFVCSEQECLPPVSSTHDALNLLVSMEKEN